MTATNSQVPGFVKRKYLIETKGQMKSECIYEIIDFPKYHPKTLIHFCPGRFYRLGTYADCKCNAPLLILLIAETKYAIENNGQAIKNMKSYDLI